MGLLKLGILGAAGYGLYKYAVGKSRQGRSAQPAFALGEGVPGNDTQIRNAGSEAMRDQPRRWTPTDETSDASFPASDPPSTY